MDQLILFCPSYVQNSISGSIVWYFILFSNKRKTPSLILGGDKNASAVAGIKICQIKYVELHAGTPFE